MEEFVRLHKDQLDALNIPDSLYSGLKYQFEEVFTSTNNHTNHENEIRKQPKGIVSPDQQSVISTEDNVDDTIDLYHLSNRMNDLLLNHVSDIDTAHGAIILIPHICSWDMNDSSSHSNGLLYELNQLDVSVLQIIFIELTGPLTTYAFNTQKENCDHDVQRLYLINAIADHPEIWSRVILYRNCSDDGTISVRGALPAPPYFKQRKEIEDEDSLLSGPFPFQYKRKIIGSKGAQEDVITIQVSLGYISPGVLYHGIPSIDFVPSNQCPDQLTRSIRHVMLLQDTDIPIKSKQTVQESYANFVRDMHLVRQRKLERTVVDENDQYAELHQKSEQPHSQRVYRVYTDKNDPMQLSDPIVGLEQNSKYFQMVDNPNEADIIFSLTSLFNPNNELYQIIETRRRQSNDDDSTTTILINQFPYEGAFVQKDHLAREILNQHGLPRPFWSIESYDLDVQLLQFAGAALNARSNNIQKINDNSTDHNNTNTDDRNYVNDNCIWIVKPSNGTRSKGHVVTRNLSYIQRLLDTGNMNRIVQRYITNPVCYDGCKTDCRIVVLMTNARCGHPALWMHQNVYFRIANKPHLIVTASDLADHESVLTATHLLDNQTRTSDSTLRTLPIDHKTIQKLEQEYNGSFDWNKNILPQIQTLICDLFNGMTNAFPAMEQSVNSRAVYGVDVMFEIDDNDNSITPKLTEVTFCPANNAVCDAYERNEDLYRSYNKDIYELLFLGIKSERIIQLQ